MPEYVFICPVCGRKETRYYCMNDRHECICEVCGTAMKKSYKDMIPAYHDVPFDSVDYDITGNPIPYSTKGQLKKIAKAHGLEVT